MEPRLENQSIKKGFVIMLQCNSYQYNEYTPKINT